MKCFRIHQGGGSQVEQHFGSKNGADELMLQLLFIIVTAAAEEAA